MKPNVNNIRELINEKFGGNQSSFARTIGVDRTQVSMLLNHGDKVGAKFYGGLLALCEQEGLNYKNYIILPQNVKKINTSKQKEVV